MDYKASPRAMCHVLIPMPFRQDHTLLPNCAMTSQPGSLSKAAATEEDSPPDRTTITSNILMRRDCTRSNFIAHIAKHIRSQPCRKIAFIFQQLKVRTKVLIEDNAKRVYWCNSWIQRTVVVVWKIVSIQDRVALLQASAI